MTLFQVKVSLSTATASYNCSSSCSNERWVENFNKIWGKGRCGYTHDHHQDSDRFVWRRCTVKQCPGYAEGDSKVQLAAYSYDNGIKPYTEEKENPNLSKVFSTLLLTEVIYSLALEMNADGQSRFRLSTSSGDLIEEQVIQHDNKCEDNYFEGILHGLYFGGTCVAPEDISIQYFS